MDAAKGFQYSEDENVSNLQQAFRSRVYDQKTLARKNDFEEKIIPMKKRPWIL